MSWEPTIAISTAIYTATVVVASGFAILQWREIGATRQLESTLALLNRLQGSALSATRDHFRRDPTLLRTLMRSGEPLVELDKYLQGHAGPEGLSESLAEFRKTLRELEFIAILCLNGAIPKNVERAYLAPTVMSYWTAFSPFIETVRQRRGDKIYLQHVSAVVEMIADGSLFDRRCPKVKRTQRASLLDQGMSGARWRWEEHLSTEVAATSSANE